MDWTDQGLILATRKHGENAVIASILTINHGRCLGLIHGGQSKRWSALLQVGNAVAAHWRARLPEQLGHFQLESLTAWSARWLPSPLILGIISSACAVTEACLAERHPMPQVYENLLELLQISEEPEWPTAYVRWECALLGHLGYGLDLERCALTGSRDHLAYVSPRTGRAASAEAGALWKQQLLPLPAFLNQQNASWTYQDILDGLTLTGHFLSRHVLDHAQGRHARSVLPIPRQRLTGMIQRMLSPSQQASA